MENQNEKLKQDAIAKAYGEYWEEVINYVNDGGWCPNAFAKYDTWNGNFDLYVLGMHRPKYLSGIENNNGWIRILPDGSNLPHLDGGYENYDVCTLYSDRSFSMIYKKKSDEVHFLFKQTEEKEGIVVESFGIGITHFRPVIEHNPPIY